MKKIYVCAVVFLMSVPVFTQTAQRTYFLGHSLINLNMPAMFHSLATDAGYTANQYDYQIGNGGNLWNQWDTTFGTEQGLMYYDALPTGNYDHFIFTEAVPLQGHLQYSYTYDYADSLCSYAASYNPSVRMYVYETWHCVNSGTPAGCEWDNDDHIAWRTRLDTDLPKWEGIADTLQARNPSHQYFIVPGGQGLAALYDAIEANTVPGLDSIQQVFTDDIHLTEAGNYFIACIMYACIYGESPEGLTNQTYSEWGVPFTLLPPALAARLQEIAWQTVCNYPRSGVAACQLASHPDQVLPEWTWYAAQSQVVFTQPFTGKLSLVDMQGRMISQSALESSLQHTIPALLPGIYLLQAENSNGNVLVQKIAIP